MCFLYACSREMLQGECRLETHHVRDVGGSPASQLSVGVGCAAELSCVAHQKIGQHLMSAHLHMWTLLNLMSAILFLRFVEQSDRIELLG